MTHLEGNAADKSLTDMTCPVVIAFMHVGNRSETNLILPKICTTTARPK